MDDDFNTPEALAVMQGVARDLNNAKAGGKRDESAALAATLRDMGEALGLLQQSPERYLKQGVGTASLSDEEIDDLLAQRRTARAAKNFGESDRIRALLTAAGIVLEDRSDGTSWRRA
jgi:cysteinyl-tRNA synthetase